MRIRHRYTKHKARIRSGRVVMASVAAGGLLLAACGSGGGSGVASAGGEADNPAAAEDDTELLDDDAQALVFAECMRDNGIDMPDPGPGMQGLGQAFQSVAGNYDRATLEQAFVACEDQIPQFAQEQEHERADILELAECLREQGLDVSDSPFDDAHSGAIDQNEFAAAMEVCREVLAGGGS